ncbi:glycoside hydrolase family 6 protein [Rathayibacter sp. YIM 133350]|uniref:glycoside hydrolase family 6 protein n=1 Tax=Rathayibacter sp. YIM 133350 TaxID=3131992 RepID=UPI00307E67AF
MTKRSLIRASCIAAVAAVATLGLAAAPAVAANDVLSPGTALYVDPHSTTLEAASTLTGQARTDAQLLGSFASATWLTKGTPSEAQAAASKTTTDAAAANAVPTLVVYNLPYRDCSQYSAGGAANTADYEAWVDAVAAGIGGNKAVIILEPDGLGIIPWYTSNQGQQEWCQPADADPATAASDRFAALNHAVDALTALPNTAVYLDGTHSGWLSVGDISDRLDKAGVAKADGFFLNASNYIATPKLQKYGTWISDCLRLKAEVSWWDYGYCGSQYFPATASDFSTWGATDADYAQRFADAGITVDPSKQKHFVIDTSRNGQDAWTPPVWNGDIEAWCNPPDRGAGERPTADTKDALIDAFLWIKVPGESDGQCFRSTAGPLDPIRGIQDPPAGQWFPEQARELIAFASPAFETPACHVSYSATRPLFGLFAGDIAITNTGSVPLKGWTLKWSWEGSEKLITVVGGTRTQSGDALTLTSTKLTSNVKAGATTHVGFIGRGAAQRVEPWLFTLNGKPCAAD